MEFEHPVEATPASRAACVTLNRLESMDKKLISFFTLVFSVWLLAGCATRTYTNPVCAMDVPDPSVKKLAGQYYVFGTTGDSRTQDGRIFSLLRSSDLVHWTPLGGALIPPSEKYQQYWAPEITERDGKFYLYYAAGYPAMEHFVIRAGVSDRPEGPYVDSGSIVQDCETNRFTIDPYPFRDDDGQWYLFYACDFPFNSPDAHAGTGIAADRLSDMTHLSCERQVIVRPAQDWTLYETNRWMDAFQKRFAQWHTIEAPCVVKHDGKYYCFYSGANWQTSRYGVDYVVSDNPLGPYRGAGDHARVLHGIEGKIRGPGGATIVTGPDGETQYMVYHAWNQAMTERQLCIDRLVWTPNGPRVTPTTTPQPAP
jgi:beta-xylosidase